MGVSPLFSFKEKHRQIKGGIDFIKVKDYAVINLNNMFPVTAGSCQRVDFKAKQKRPLPGASAGGVPRRQAASRQNREERRQPLQVQG